MDRIEIEKLRSLPCEGVAQRLGLVVRQHKALCPFHNDHTPSMTFKKGKWKCWSCGEGGDTISLVQKVLNKNFPEACRWLADENNVILTEYRPKEEKPPKPFDASRYNKYFERPFLNDEARRFLFDERKLDPRVVRWCRLTSWKDRNGTPWLQIPYYDMEGKLIGVQNRNLGKKGERKKGDGLIPTTPQTNLHPSSINLHPNNEPRFRFPAGSRCGIYNLPVLNMMKPGEELWITEGCSDCWAMLSSGHKAIAIPSATLLSQADKEQLSIVNCQLSIKLNMFPDADVPGERLFLQLKEVLPDLVRHQLPPGCKDYSDFFLREKSLVKS